MAKKKIEKRKFVEGILNLEVFSDMLTQTRNEYNTVTKEFDIECMRYEEVSKNIETYEKQIVQHKENIKVNHQKVSDQLQENTREISRLTESLSAFDGTSLSGISSQITDYEKKLTKCEQKINDKAVELAQHKTELKFLQSTAEKLSVDNDECPMCLRAISKNDQQHIIDEQNKINDKIKNTGSVIDNFSDGELKKLKSMLENKIRDLCHEKIKVQEASIRKDSISGERDKIYQWSEQLQTQLTAEDCIGKELKKSTTAAIDRLSEIQQNIDNIKVELNQLDIIKFIVSEEGVKSYIVKKILQVLNNKLGYYLKRMDSNCICVFNEYFEEQIFDEKGKLCSYFNFSGAERKNIDLACLFAFMDLRRLQGDIVFDFSMYDELLDSSLDERGIEIVVDILKERVTKFGEMIYIISHRKEAGTLVNTSLGKEASGEIISLQKQKGITTRVAINQE
jgi:chromosome segregation ATPase